MIKVFEDYRDYLSKNQGRKYWVIKNDQYAKSRLFKIGMPLSVINKFKKTENKQIDKFFIGYDPFGGIKEIDKWSHAQYFYTDDNSLYKNDYEFMGYAEVTEDDINNYKAQIAAKKYNL